MTTVINTPPNTDNSDRGAGWAVAVIILLVVIGIGAYLWFQYGTPSTATPATPGQTNINVTLPSTPAKSGTPAQ